LRGEGIEKFSLSSASGKIGAEAHALQTLRAMILHKNFAERSEWLRFSVALRRAGIGFEVHDDGLHNSEFQMLPGDHAIAVPNFGRKDC
jgi:hypothetical protein